MFSFSAESTIKSAFLSLDFGKEFVSAITFIPALFAASIPAI